jgi:hypothetical protein
MLWAENYLLVANNYLEFEVCTAVIMKSTIFWDITPCSPLKVNRRFGGVYRLQGLKLTTHLQLVPKSRKRGSIHPLPQTPSWRSA